MWALQVRQRARVPTRAGIQLKERDRQDRQAEAQALQVSEDREGMPVADLATFSK